MNNFTILIPVHNEADKLLRNLGVLIAYLERFSNNYNVLLVENGSKDTTRDLLNKAAKLYSNVSFTTLGEANLGRALYKGAMLAKSDYVVYLPIDLSVGLEFVPASLQCLDTYDIAVGSKRLKASTNKRPIVRKLLSRCYNLLIRLFFKTDLTDTTCVKAFRRNRILPILRNIRFKNILETELLIKAEKARCRIIEIPVRVNDKRLPKENLLLKIKRKLVALLAFKIAS